MRSDRKTNELEDPLGQELRTNLGDALSPLLDERSERQIEREAGPHPDVDQLIRYHCGELDEAAEERLQAHLVACPDCLEDLLDLDGFVGAGARASRTASEARFEIDSKADSGGAPEAPPEIEPSRSAPWWLPPVAGAPRRAALALAASILVAISGLTFWAIRERSEAEDLRERVVALSAPRPDVPIVDLLPDSAVRGRSEERVPGVDLPPGEDYFTFVLNLPQLPAVTDFQVDLVGSDGRVSWSGPLRRSTYGTFTLGVPRRSLSAGENELRLYGVDGGGRRLLETYTVRLEPEESASGP